MRPGKSAWRRRNHSATFSALWFGSMMPPEPTRIPRVVWATSPMRISGDELARLAALWCSASQYRVKPRRSTCWARSSVFLRASPADEPETIGERSRADTRSWGMGPRL